MKVKQIELEVGIYNTYATIIRHRDKTVTIKSPYIKWSNNTGSLDFKKINLTGDAAEIASNNIFIDGATESYNEFIYQYSK